MDRAQLVARAKALLVRPQNRAVATTAYRATERHAYAPPEMPCAALDEFLDTGRFTIEGYATGNNWQPGTMMARFDVQDFTMNAAMGGSGQTNANLSLPYALVNAAFLRAGNPMNPRVRLTVEIY